MGTGARGPGGPRPFSEGGLVSRVPLPAAGGRTGRLGQSRGVGVGGARAADSRESQRRCQEAAPDHEGYPVSGCEEALVTGL